MKIGMIVLGLLFVTMVAGCTQIPETPQLTQEEFDSNSSKGIYSEGNYAVANVGFSTATPCYGMSATANMTGNNITFLVDIHSTLGPGQGCVQVIGDVSSKFSYGPLPRGVYTVSVIADYTTSAWPTQTIGPQEIVIT